MSCRCENGWVCEMHPDQPFGHDSLNCGEPGTPCLNLACPHGRRWIDALAVDAARDRREMVMSITRLSVTSLSRLPS